ncbi:ribosomal protein L31 [Limnobacter thiooxidans]|nr:ribosomal protein L31 [Limnobacter thiooxidans]
MRLSKRSTYMRLKKQRINNRLTHSTGESIIRGYLINQQVTRPCRTKTAGLAATEKLMKDGIHPNYREMLFIDMSNGFKFICRSTASSRETGEFEGKEYPVIKLDVSSESHPFYTGAQNTIVDTAGRVEKFRRRFDRFKK